MVFKRLKELIKKETRPTPNEIKEQFIEKLPDIWFDKLTKEWQDFCIKKCEFLWWDFSLYYDSERRQIEHFSLAVNSALVKK